MALKNVAVLGMTLTPDAPVAGTVTPTTPPSTKVFAPSGKGTYKGTVAVTFTGTYNGQPATGSGSVAPTALKNKVEGQAVLRKDDQGNLSGTYTNPSPPPPTLPFSGTFKVSDAGQAKVSAE